VTARFGLELMDGARGDAALAAVPIDQWGLDVRRIYQHYLDEDDGLGTP